MDDSPQSEQPLAWHKNWPNGLSSFTGSLNRLSGIKIYHDFNWEQVVRHGRRQFPNGQKLTALVKNKCPDDLVPALFLTVNADVQECFFSTEKEYVCVVRILDYLQNCDADPASAYLFQTQIVTTANLDSILLTPEAARSIVDKHINLDAIRKWTGEDAKRLQDLAAIAGSGERPDTQASSQQIADNLVAIEKIDPDLLDALVALCGKMDSKESKARVLKAVTGDAEGQAAFREVAGEQLSVRLADVDRVASEYNELIESGATETDLQDYIEENPWLLGLEYTRVRKRQPIARGQIDFLVERYDGFHDIVELKGPNEAIVKSGPTDSEAPPSPHSFALSKALSQALAQSHLYRDQLTQHEEVMKLYGVANTRNPRITIVLGRASTLSAAEAGVLEQLNLSLHRVQVVPYDLLGRRAMHTITNVKKYLGLASLDDAVQVKNDGSIDSSGQSQVSLCEDSLSESPM